MSACYPHHTFPPHSSHSHTLHIPLPTYSPIAYAPLCTPFTAGSKLERTTFSFIENLLSSPYSVSTNAPRYSYNPSVIHILCSCDTCVCAADSSCFFTVTGLWRFFTVNGLWHWVANWCKCCVLQTAVASLQSPDCDTEWLIGVNVVCCRQQLLLYSQRTVILSGWLV